MNILKAIGRLPRVIGDAMYEREPVSSLRSIDMESIRPDEDYIVQTPIGAVPMKGSQVPQDMPVYKDMQVGSKRSDEKSKLGNFVSGTLPRMLSAGIASAATPNIAGGGATDVFRGMAAGADHLQRRDIMAYEMAQQRQRAAIEQQRAQAQIANDEAQRGMYDAHAEAYRAQANKADNDVVTLPPGAAIVSRTDGKVLYRNPTAEPRPTILAPGAVAVDGEGRTIASAPPRETRPAPHRGVQTDNKGNVTAFEIGPDGKPRITPVGRIGKPTREPRDPSDKPRVGTPAQFVNVQRLRDQAFDTAKRDLDRRIKDASTKGWQGSEFEEAKRQAREEYDERMKMAQQSYEQGIVSLGGSVAPRNAGPAGARPAAATPQAPSKADEYMRRFANR